jgi:hypothetical protein
MQNWRWQYLMLSINDIRCRMHALLRGLADAHSCQIVDRDVKPDKFGVNLKRRQIKLLV